MRIILLCIRYVWYWPRVMWNGSLLSASFKSTTHPPSLEFARATVLQVAGEKRQVT